MTASAATRFGLLAKLVAAALALLAAGQAAFVLRDESKIGAASAELGKAHLLVRHNYPITPGSFVDLPLEDIPPRGALMGASVLTVAAAAEREPAVRAGLLERARRSAQVAAAARPVWGEAWAVIAFSSALRGGEQQAGVRRAFERSYRDAPYLRRAAAWRVAYAFRNWPLLSEETRRRSVNEAVWLARIDKRVRDQVFVLARQSDAFIPMMTAWRASRLDDVDYLRSYGVTP